jgi:hypothetical protein
MTREAQDLCWELGDLRVGDEEPRRLDEIYTLFQAHVPQIPALDPHGVGSSRGVTMIGSLTCLCQIGFARSPTDIIGQWISTNEDSDRSPPPSISDGLSISLKFQYEGETPGRGGSRLLGICTEEKVHHPAWRVAATGEFLVLSILYQATLQADHRDQHSNTCRERVTDLTVSARMSCLLNAKTRETIAQVRRLAQNSKPGRLIDCQQDSLRSLPTTDPVDISEAKLLLPNDTNLVELVVEAIRSLGDGSESFSVPAITSVAAEWIVPRNGNSEQRTRADVAPKTSTILYFHGGQFW